MTLTELETKLNKLNHNIHIYRGSNDNAPAGVYVILPTYEGGEYHELCGIEKWNMKEWPTYSKQGKMLTGGWNRVLGMLASRHLIDVSRSRKLFGRWDSHREPPFMVEQTAIDTAIGSMQIAGYKRIENPLCEGEFIDTPVYKNDEVVDIGRMIHKDNGGRLPPSAESDGTI